MNCANSGERSGSLTWVAVALAAFAVSASAQSITSVGSSPGGSYSAARGVSGNGTAVAVAVDPFGEGSSYRWNSREGLLPLGALPGAFSTSVSDISRNGAVLVGTSFLVDESVKAWRWTAWGGYQDLGLPPGGVAAFANGTSRNGNVVVGLAFTEDFSMNAFRWTSRGGMQSLGTLPGGSFSSAAAVSDNGRVVVGQGDLDGREVAFRWTPEGGMQALPYVGPETGFANAFGVSRDGSVVAGLSGNRAVLWVNGQVRDLGMLPGDDAGVAFALNRDGSLVGGYSFNGGQVRATLWTAASGMVDLNTYLPQVGVDLTGWTLKYVRDLSLDGRTIVGEGTYLGAEVGWVVKLPAGARTGVVPEDGDDDDSAE